VPPAEPPNRGRLHSPERLLAARLLADAPEREASIAGFIFWLALAGAAAGLSLWPALGARQSLGIGGGLGVLALYYGGLRRALRAGWYRPWIRWLNIAIETSAPAGLYLLDLHYHGPEFALTAPPLAIWATMILLSALRCSRRLAIWAGTLAAVECAFLYFVLTRPGLPAGAIATFSPPFILVRVGLLFASGFLTAIIAGDLVRTAEAAIVAIRERDVMGKYVLQERLGEGGMAEVYRAIYSPEGGFEKQVAVKRIHSFVAADPEFLALFRREAKIGSLLAHPNVVQFLDFGRYQGNYFIAMEFVEGLSLEAGLRVAGRLPLSAVAYLCAELAEALDYLHRRCSIGGKSLGLVHRDINPPNILISRDGDVKLADFGIARAVRGSHLTEIGTVRGKIRYMAPEVLEGKPFNQRADLFSLGVMLYLAITGVLATEGSDREQIVRRIVENDFLPPSVLRSEVPRDLDALVVGLLARDPGRRTPDARTLVQQALALGGVAAPWPDGKSELLRWVERAGAGPTEATEPAMTSPTFAARPTPRGKGPAPLPKN